MPDTPYLTRHYSDPTSGELAAAVARVNGAVVEAEWQQQGAAAPVALGAVAAYPRGPGRLLKKAEIAQIRAEVVAALDARAFQRGFLPHVR